MNGFFILLRLSDKLLSDCTDSSWYTYIALVKYYFADKIMLTGWYISFISNPKPHGYF